MCMVWYVRRVMSLMSVHTVTCVSMRSRWCVQAMWRGSCVLHSIRTLEEVMFASLTAHTHTHTLTSAHTHTNFNWVHLNYSLKHTTRQILRIQLFIMSPHTHKFYTHTHTHTVDEQWFLAVERWSQHHICPQSAGHYCPWGGWWQPIKRPGVHSQVRMQSADKRMTRDY